jgi:hypothetical protein
MSLQQSLMDAFDFTAEDFAANQAGSLSQRQREMLSLQKVGAGCGRFGVLLPVGAGFLYLFADELDFGGGIVTVVLILALMVVLIGASYAAIQAAQRSYDDQVLNDAVQSWRGRAHLTDDDRLLIGETIFHLLPSQVAALRGAGTVQIHWLPSTQTILSVGVIEKDASVPGGHG